MWRKTRAGFGEDKINAAIMPALSYHCLGPQREARAWREVAEWKLWKANAGMPRTPTRWRLGHWFTVNAWRMAGEQEWEMESEIAPSS